ncbi:hypothetical protein SAMN05444004_10540 [Jannaschia faecimaris]|uniref:Uncharacterized protein n=1 Tax=Jannaschia faecimaris TaxID=1244108 RepID=A0A1H3PK41_9RHOB|nr:hypothetical protein [Jannaschia faecimaris]SDZ01421.1 hypothetical protein SAMN05444004_10540 [Jannaschia faecimaris]
MIATVVFPLVLLALAAWVIPWLLSKVMPEGVFWLFLIGVISAVALALIAAVGFFVLYGRAGEAVLDVAPWYFVILSARAALVWGPVMVLSLANIPKNWKEAVW